VQREIFSIIPMRVPLPVMKVVKLLQKEERVMKAVWVMEMIATPLDINWR
jgi:hypothetical protein